MQEATIPRRWARAFVETVLELDQGKTDGLSKVEGDLSLLARALTGSTDLKNAMFHPAFSSTQREAVLMDIATAASFQEVTRRFMRLLIEKGRLRYLEGIAAAFRAEVDTRLGRVRATVTSAKPLDAAALTELQQALKARVGKDVIAEVHVDETVISGLKAQIGGLVYDGTVRSQLDRMRASLL
jgi:F-type H+-transporting ATPase subunit delta